MKFAALVLSGVVLWPLAAQAAPPTVDPWQSISFLEGTWEAKTEDGSAAKVLGTYSFEKELKGHVLSRLAHVTGCTGPKTFDCQHNDLLYVFQESPGQAFKAVYFDNEGHVIHYEVSTPDAATAIFLSEPGVGARGKPRLWAA